MPKQPITVARDGSHPLKRRVGDIVIGKDWENQAVTLEQGGVTVSVPVAQVRHLIDALAASAVEIAGTVVGDDIFFV